MGAYNPINRITSFNGAPISGFAPGTFLKITRRKAAVVLEELGPDGEGAFVVSGDQSYDIEVTLQASSPSNDLLSQWLKATSDGAPVIGAFTSEELGTGSTFRAKQVMITEGPPMEGMGGDKMGTHVWKFAAKRGEMDLRGFST
jgi:hypothetical protein